MAQYVKQHDPWIDYPSTSTLLDANALNGWETGIAAASVKPGFTSGLLIYVSETGSDSNDGLSWGSAFATLAKAVTEASAHGGVRANVFIGPGQFNIGTAASSAVGLTVSQNLHLYGHGQGPGTGNQGGTELRYLGTGIAVETAFDAASGWSGGIIKDLAIINAGTGTIGLHVRNPQNLAYIENVRVGSTANSAQNFSTNAFKVESTDVVNSNQYPGFFQMNRCWGVGGVTPWRVMGGVTQTLLIGCGADSDANTTIGFNHVDNASPATGTDLTLVGFKYEGHNDSVGYKFDVNCNINLIGCTARQDTMGTKNAYQYTPAPTGPGYPRMNLVGCSAMNFATWLGMPNLVLSAGNLGTMSSNTVFTSSYFSLGHSRFRRLGMGGSNHSSGQYALSAGWGSTASVSIRSGCQDQRFEFTVTSAGTGQSANPTVTITFSDGGFIVSPFALVTRNGGAQPTVHPTNVPASSTLTITFPTTPVAGETYTFSGMIVG